MKCLITGAKGQLGYDVIKELKNRGYNEILATDRDNMDITDETQVMKIIEDYQPDVIFHCAAYTNVDQAEEDINICTKVNVDGTRNLVSAAKKVGSKLLYISTDYVFDGTKDGIYETKDTPNPKSIYGLTKYKGELEALKHDKAFIVRISWVFGINGDNFVKKMLRLAETKKELSIVNDQVGSPTYTVDLSKLLIDMAQTDKYGIYHATNKGFISWYYFAKAIFETAGINIKLNPVSSDAFPSKAERPMNSRLSKENLIENGFKPLPSWEDALYEYINEELIYKKEYVKRK